MKTALSWTTGRWRLDGQLAYRAYEETNAGADFLPVEEDGWHVTELFQGSQKTIQVRPR